MCGTMEVKSDRCCQNYLDMFNSSFEVYPVVSCQILKAGGCVEPYAASGVSSIIPKAAVRETANNKIFFLQTRK